MTGIDLNKRTEAAGVSLMKAAERATEDLGDVSLQVTLEVDFSGSMGPFYGNDGGAVQETVERALAFILTGLDPDGIVPVNFYDGSVYPTVLVSDGTKRDTEPYQGVVQRFMRTHMMGGTRYTPPIQSALSIAAEDATGYPFLHLFLTDGAPGDRASAEQLLLHSRTTKNFFQFIQFGTDPDATAYLKRLDKELTGEGLDNIGVTHYASPHEITDEAFFDDICSEVLPVWLPKARAAGYAK